MKSEMDPAIRFSAVTKVFGRIRAVESLDFIAPTGAVTVLLGPNGAGKTTTVRLTTGALVADRGNIEVLGLHPKTDGDEVRRRTGVVPPKPAFYDQLTGWENLQFAARIFAGTDAAAYEAAERFAIEDALDQEVGGYSTGMRTRLALARAVIHDPEVLLLDEPTAGLPDNLTEQVMELIKQKAAEGMSVVIVEHDLTVIWGLSDLVHFMAEGSVILQGDPASIREHETVVEKYLGSGHVGG